MNDIKDRENIANEEIGKTEITPRQSQIAILFFLTVIFFVFTIQLFSFSLSLFLPVFQKKQDNEGVVAQIKKTNIKILQQLDIFERELEKKSIIRRISISPLQWFMLALGRGNEKVVIGKSGWLYYRKDIDAILGNSFLKNNHFRHRKKAHALWENSLQPNPIKAITNFRDQLALLDIELFIVIAPIKPPFAITRSYINKKKLYNRAFPLFLEELDQANIKYFDPFSIFAEEGYKYLRTDTHWRPEAMEFIAKKTAKHINTFANSKEKLVYDIRTIKINGKGDIQRMLKIGENSKKRLYPAQQIILHQVLQQGNFWKSQKDAEILLLGDSFTNIYSKKDLGWGHSAGFAEHLSRFLQKPIDVLSRNDDGAFMTRQMLASELLRGENRLAGKRLVIWEFSARELFYGDWRLIDLPAIKKVNQKNVVPEFIVCNGREKIIEATVQAISPSPRPGSVPYQDNLVTLYLTIYKKGSPNGQKALVYAFGMKDNKLTKINSLQIGERIKIRLSPWENVEEKYGTIRRSILEDELLELETPNWGELLE